MRVSVSSLMSFLSTYISMNYLPLVILFLTLAETKSSCYAAKQKITFKCLERVDDFALEVFF
jgi:hypothetical protein